MIHGSFLLHCDHSAERGLNSTMMHGSFLTHYDYRVERKMNPTMIHEFLYAIESTASEEASSLIPSIVTLFGRQTIMPPAASIAPWRIQS